MFCVDVIAAAASDSMDWRAVQERRSQESIDKVQIFNMSYVKRALYLNQKFKNIKQNM